MWRWRLKVKKEGWPDMSSIEYRCGELLKKNQKIQAIKDYRAYMEKMGNDCGLRQAKEWVDKLAIKLDLDK